MKSISVYLIGSIVLLAGHFALAQYSQCTRWEKKDTRATCYFANTDSQGVEWVRECSEPCERRFPFQPPQTKACDHEWICMPSKRFSGRHNLTSNPNHLKGSCTDWIKQKSIRCQAEDDSWQDMWMRSCQRNLPETTCSNKDPNR